MRWHRWLAVMSLAAIASATSPTQDSVDVRIREELRAARADKELVKNVSALTDKVEAWLEELTVAANATKDAEQRWTLRALALDAAKLGKSEKIDAARAKLSRALLEEFVGDEKKMLELVGLDATPDFRAEMLKRTKSDAVKATILFSDARTLMTRARTVELTEKEREQMYALLERVAKDHGDALDSLGRKWGDVARGSLAAQRDLVIGKPAPEIEGADLDGTAFKLSDYRGKVVVIDFWGNW